MEELETESFLTVDSALFVISSNAYKLLSEQLQKDVLFYPCEVWLADKKFDFFVGKIITKRNLINHDKSTFWTFDDGIQILQTAKFYKEVEEDFYLARDITYYFRYAASSKFADLIRKHNLNIPMIPHVTETSTL